MRNHNHLLGRVDGVDGIKTGYIRDSGFNIVTSVQRGNRRIVAVVFGGRSAGWRDARMRSLIEGNIAEASVKRTAPLVVERWEGKGKLAAAPTPAAAALVHIPVPAAAPPAAAPAQLGSTAPIKPHAVKTVTVMVAPNANNGATADAAAGREPHAGAAVASMRRVSPPPQSRKRIRRPCRRPSPRCRPSNWRRRARACRSRPSPRPGRAGPR